MRNTTHVRHVAMKGTHTLYYRDRKSDLRILVLQKINYKQNLFTFQDTSTMSFSKQNRVLVAKFLSGPD